MGIINGTFDTDLNGWEPTINGNADVIWDNGKARLRIYKCDGVASMQQTFVIGKTLSFDYISKADQWTELPGLKLIVDGAVVIDERIPFQTGTLQVGQPVSGTISKDVSAYEGKTATVQFNIIPSSYCGNSDHGNTYLWIDNVTTPCTPNWQCEQPLNGYESDGCGNRRLNSACNPCTPNWQCEPGQTGYEIDGCGNRRENPACLAKGSIKFTSTPAGAEIFLDGMDQDEKTPKTITNVPVGSHEYILKLEGFKDSTDRVQVLENQTAEVSVSLIPLESCIYFVTSVPGAKIYVDNVDKGKFTPDLICGLGLGSHTYGLELPGYVAVRGTAGIGAGQGVVVASVLTPVEKGIGAGTILGITILSIGVLGAVVLAIRKRQPPTARQYLKYPLTPR